MKKSLALLLFLCSSLLVFAQRPLTDSRTNSPYTYIYRLDDASTVLFLTGKEKDFKDEVLKDPVYRYQHDNRFADTRLSFERGNVGKPLGPGNYLEVSAEKNTLYYHLIQKHSAVFKQILNGFDVRFMLLDSNYAEITNAVVHVGKKLVKYDEASRSYHFKQNPKDTLIKAEYQGVSNFYIVKENKNNYYDRPVKRPGFWTKLFHSKGKPDKQQQTTRTRYLPYGTNPGFMVFNKPKYRPNDTVKFKAFILQIDSKKPIGDKQLNVRLTNGNDAGKIIGKVSAYRPGGFEYQFKLTDSLDIRLDNDYKISLEPLIPAKSGKEKNNDQANDMPVSYHAGSFSYEEYELKANKFNIRIDGHTQSPGKPAPFYLKATDDNGLNVADGRVHIVVKPGYISEYGTENVFIPDTLGIFDIPLDPVGETKFIIPDSILPKVKMNVGVSIQMRNSNNENHDEYRSINWTNDNRELSITTEGDSLSIRYLLSGKSAPIRARLYEHAGRRDTDVIKSIDLPAKIAINPMLEGYSVKVDGLSQYFYTQQAEARVDPQGLRTADSLYLRVYNPRKLKFWYTVFGDKKIIAQGSGTEFDYRRPYKSTGSVSLLVNFVWAGRPQYLEQQVPYQDRVLNIKVKEPISVFPGQQTEIEAEVTDDKGKPVSGADITAYGITGKFEGYTAPTLPYLGKSYEYRKLKPWVTEQKLDNDEGELKLNWKHWGAALGLDTIKYYQFTHPADTFKLVEPTPDKVTQLAPFVVKNGNIQPVHVLSIDDKPVYFDQSQEYPQYSFVVDTDYHSIKMRTDSALVEVYRIKVPLGKKLILSVSADSSENKFARIQAMPDTLTKTESELLSRYMIKAIPNFGNKMATLEQNNRIHLFNYYDGYAYNNYNGYNSYNYRSAGTLLGPFANNNVELDVKTQGSQFFTSEGGFSFEFTPGLLKQRSITGGYGFSTKLNQPQASDIYKQYALGSNGVDTLWRNVLDQRAMQYLANGDQRSGNCRLIVRIGDTKKAALPPVKCVMMFKKDDTDFLQLIPGNRMDLYNHEPGEYRLLYLFKNNTYHIQNNIVVKPRGWNFYNIGYVQPHPADSMSKRLGQIIIDQVLGASVKACNEAIRETFFAKHLDMSTFKKQIKGKVFDLREHFPLAGVTITVSGTTRKTVTDKNGDFKLIVPARGSLKATMENYESTTVGFKGDSAVKIYMMFNLKEQMREALVRGYIRRSREQTTGSSTIITAREVQDVPVANVEQLLQGKVAGLNIQNNTGAPGMRGSVNIRGLSTIANTGTGGGTPLYVVDGVVVNNNPLKTTRQEDVSSMEILKDASATALYGSRAAYGVVLITTVKGRAKMLADQLTGKSSRRNFSDYAYWQPKLTSDAEGKVKFKVTYPDDITSWRTYMVGITDNRQTGVAQGVVKSYKPVSAYFTAPLFAVRGDTLLPIGKMLNYVNDTMTVNRKFSYNGKVLSERSVLLKNSHIDTFKVVADGKDSLNFEYALKRANGYADGEYRTIPIFEQGTLETKGIFKTLDKDTTFALSFEPGLTEVTLRAEASALPVLLDEVQHLRNYEYLCNEQLASKLKALLVEKQIRAYLKEPFKWDIAIKDIIKKLNDSRRTDGTWGWWKDTAEEMWISMHVSEALVMAKAQGFTVQLDEQKLINYLVYQGDSYKGEDKLRVIALLKMLGSTADLKLIMANYEKQLLTKPLISDVEKLRLMHTRQTIGLPIQIDSLLKNMKKTMFGNAYWGVENYHLFNNSIQGTLLAYKILKAEGKHAQLLTKLRNYFLEQRGNGNWRNTYESAQILETILPDLLINGEKPRPAVLNISGSKNETVRNFPYETKLDANANINISKNGDLPVYITAFQKFWNRAPKKVSTDFQVDTWFRNVNQKITTAKGGEAIVLTVEVTARADADMAMVEIPIPAGCSYNGKAQGYGNGEVHREYFKNKVSIFCRKLTQGKHTFTISLMPRYSGTYTVNPAKAEMMYFPVFYGREEMKKLSIN